MPEPTLVGRDAELAILAEALASAGAGNGRTMLVGGDGGVGKTALMHTFTQRSGVGALWGTTPVAAGEPLPYAVFVDLLHSVGRDHPATLVALGEAHRDLAPLLPGTTDLWPAAQSDPFARHRLVDAVRVVLEHVAAQRPPLLVVLDDLHWADDASLAMLSYLVHQLHLAPVLLIAAYRSDALEDEPRLGRLLAELVRLEHVNHLELGGLSGADLLSMSQAERGELSADDARAMAVRAAGNPFMFRQLIVLGGAAAGGLPRDLRQLLLARVATLPPFVRAVAQACAVAGRSATSALVSALLPGHQSEVINALRVLVRAGVLDPPPAVGKPYTFHHPLLQEAVIDDLLPEERAGLHRRIGATLERNASGTSVKPTELVEAAIHWAAADDEVRAVPALIAGAQAAQQVHAFELAHSFLEKALEATSAAGGGGEMVAQLRLRAADAAYLSGKPDRAIELAREARQGLTGDQSATARLLERMGWYQLAAGDMEAALSAFAEAATLIGQLDHSERGRVLASYGRGLMLAARYGEAVGILEQAVDFARDGGSPADESRALSALGVALVRTGRAAEGSLRIEEGRRLDEQRGESLAAPRPSRIGYLIGSLLDRATVLEASGELRAATAETHEASELARRLGGMAAFGGAIALRSAYESYLLGHWPAAEQALDDAKVGQPADRIAVALLRSRLECARGRLAEAASALEDAQATLTPGTSPALLVAAQLAAAEVALARDRPNGAMVVVDEALQMDFGEDQTAMAELVALGLRADADRAEVARLRRSGGDVEAIREHGLTLAGRAAMAAGSTVGDGSTAGRLAALRRLSEAEFGRLSGSQDAEQWRATADAFAELGEPYSVAYARLREAEALLISRRERQRAEDALREAYRVASTLGALRLAGEARELARRSRIVGLDEDEGSTSSDLRPVDELGLSPRELEVLVLVADGRTNRQIGEALFITEKTAGHHVSSILTKLGLASRVEAAAVAHRRGLLDQPVLGSRHVE